MLKIRVFGGQFSCQTFSRAFCINPIVHCGKPDAPDYCLVRSWKMSVEVSWTMFSLKKSLSFAAPLRRPSCLVSTAINVPILPISTFFTRVKPISMAYFVQIDPAVNKCILVSMRDRTSKEKWSSVVYR